MIKPHLRSAQAAAVTPAEFHMLLALVDTDRHGYAIMQQVAEDTGGAIRLGPGTLYTAIKRLLGYGYIREVESGVDPALDDSRRKYYRLTPAGRTAAKAEASRLEELLTLARSRRILGAPPKPRGVRS
jgi:DNA-binding PadR family transcriptional regulator